jgi:hypothetical protein
VHHLRRFPTERKVTKVLLCLSGVPLEFLEDIRFKDLRDSEVFRGFPVEFWEFLESKKSKNNPFWKVSENIFFFGKNILHLHYKFKTIKKTRWKR